ncbi:hypothetical protein D3C77_574850 [compost metagenome]
MRVRHRHERLVTKLRKRNPGFARQVMGGAHGNHDLLLEQRKQGQVIGLVQYRQAQQADIHAMVQQILKLDCRRLYTNLNAHRGGQAQVVAEHLLQLANQRHRTGMTQAQDTALTLAHRVCQTARAVHINQNTFGSG